MAEETLTNKENLAPAETSIGSTTAPVWLSKASMALAGVFVLIVLLMGLQEAIDAYSEDPGYATDSHFLYAAGKLSTSSDANILYGPNPPDEISWPETRGYNYPTYYPYAPLGAMSMGVLAQLTSMESYYQVWKVLVLLASLGLAFMVARVFSSWPWRIAMAIGVVTWAPVVLNARIGQTGVFVALMTAIAVTVFLRNKALGAILMGLMAIKPTAVIGPSLLVFPEKLSIWGRFAGAAALVVLPPFLYIGPGQFFRWLDILSQRGVRDVGSVGGTHYYNQGFTSAFGWTSFAGVILALVLLIGAALVVESIQKRLGLYGGAAFALCIANLVNPHSLLYDWGTAFVVIMLLRQSSLLRADWRDLGVGALAITLFVAGQLAWDVKLHSYPVRPLTVWALCLCAAMVFVAFWPFVQSVYANRGAPAPRVATARAAAAASEESRSTNRSRRRREQRELKERGRKT